MSGRLVVAGAGGDCSGGSLSFLFQKESVAEFFREPEKHYNTERENVFTYPQNRIAALVNFCFNKSNIKNN
jgi:hypothetical protein